MPTETLSKQQKFEKRLAAAGLPPDTRDDCGCIYFEGLTAEDARDLLNCGVADPDGNTNDSQTFEEITRFLEENPSFVAHGYIVVPRRSDERITLTGVIARGINVSAGEERRFIEMFRQADEFDLDRYRAWYD